MHYSTFSTILMLNKLHDNNTNRLSCSLNCPKALNMSRTKKHR